MLSANWKSKAFLAASIAAIAVAGAVRLGLAQCWITDPGTCAEFGADYTCPLCDLYNCTSDLVGQPVDSICIQGDEHSYTECNYTGWLNICQEKYKCDIIPSDACLPVPGGTQICFAGHAGGQHVWGHNAELAGDSCDGGE